MDNVVKNIVDVGKVLLLGIIAYYVYKGGKILYSGIDAGTSAAADLYVGLTNPIVNAQIGIISRYFDDLGYLTPQAKEVFKNGFPNMYAKIFINDKLRSEYGYMLDNRIKYRDKDF